MKIVLKWIWKTIFITIIFQEIVQYILKWIMILSTLGCPIFQYDETYHPLNRWDVMLPLGKLTVFRYPNIRYPGLVNIQKTIENGPFIVDYPLKIVIFHSFLYVYRRIIRYKQIADISSCHCFIPIMWASYQISSQAELCHHITFLIVFLSSQAWMCIQLSH